VSGSPAFRRSAIASLALVPLIRSTPCLSFGCGNLAFLIGALMGGAAFPCPAAIPVAPAMAAATATAEAASRTARDSLSRPGFFIWVHLLSSEPRGGSGGLSCEGGRGGRAFAPWRPPCLLRSAAAAPEV